MPIATINVEAALFDLDGTLILSTKAVALAWEGFSKKHDLVLDDKFFHDTHGMRTTEAFKKYFPFIPNDDNKASAAFDVSIAEDFSYLAEPITGAAQLVESIPRDRWCIVTSGSYGIAHAWFEKVLIRNGLPKPTVFITADDVDIGKPHPQPYLKGAATISENLGRKIEKAVVFEDAPTGVKAGVAAGFPVIGIMSTFEADVLYAAGVSFAVKDLSHVKVKNVTKDGFSLEIDYIEKSK